MPRLTKRVAAIAAAGLAFAIGAGGIASATWQGSGTGNAFSKAAVLPTGPTPLAPVTVTQTSTSITVTWAKVQYVGTSTDVAGYVITRYKGGVTEAIGGTCTGTLGSTITTCTDVVGGSGAYQYSVTPKNSNWIGPEGTKSGTVTVNAISHSFTVTPATNTPTAGTSFNVTIVAKNNGLTDNTYTGNHTLDWSGGLTIGSFAPTYPTNPVSFSSGSATVSVTLFKAGAQTLTVTDHTDATYTGSSGTVTVNAGNAQLAYTGTLVGTSSVNCSPTTAINPGGNNTTSKTRVQVLAQDSWGNAVTLPSSGTITVLVSLSPTSGFNGITNATQTITLPTTTSPAATQYSMTRSNNSAYTGTLTASATGYASATCALSTSA